MKMEIIKCKCGYYKQYNDELCPKCGADYSTGAEYEVLPDQETAYMRWVNLGEKGFNDYMNAASQPHYMFCPRCRFQMLITETQCPKCGVPVKFKGFNYYKGSTITKIAMGLTWIQLLMVGIPAAFIILMIIYGLFVSLLR